MKKLIILLLGLIAFLPTNAQIRHEKFYDKAKSKPAVVGSFTNDSLRNGKWTWWHQNGTVYQQGTYENGVKVGTWKVFFDDGTKCAVEYHTGNGTNQEWYQNGELKSEVEVVNGKKSGSYKSWYSNGQQHDEIPYIDGSKEGASREPEQEQPQAPGT